MGLSKPPKPSSAFMAISFYQIPNYHRGPCPHLGDGSDTVSHTTSIASTRTFVQAEDRGRKPFRLSQADQSGAGTLWRDRSNGTLRGYPTSGHIQYTRYPFRFSRRKMIFLHAPLRGSAHSHISGSAPGTPWPRFAHGQSPFLLARILLVAVSHSCFLHLPRGHRRCVNFSDSQNGLRWRSWPRSRCSQSDRLPPPMELRRRVPCPPRMPLSCSMARTCRAGRSGMVSRPVGKWKTDIWRLFRARVIS